MVYPVCLLHCRLQYVPNILPGRVGRGEGRRKEEGGGREGGGDEGWMRGERGRNKDQRKAKRRKEEEEGIHWYLSPQKYPLQYDIAHPPNFKFWISNPYLVNWGITSGVNSQLTTAIESIICMRISLSTTRVCNWNKVIGTLKNNSSPTMHEQLLQSLQCDTLSFS